MQKFLGEVLKICGGAKSSQGKCAPPRTSPQKPAWVNFVKLDLLIDIYYTGTFCKYTISHVKPKKTHIHIFMREIFKNPYMIVFLLHIIIMIFKRGIKVFLVLSHSCNHALLGNTFYMHVKNSKSH